MSTPMVPASVIGPGIRRGEESRWGRGHSSRTIYAGRELASALEIDYRRSNVTGQLVKLLGWNLHGY